MTTKRLQLASASTSVTGRSTSTAERSTPQSDAPFVHLEYAERVLALLNEKSSGTGFGSSSDSSSHTRNGSKP